MLRRLLVTAAIVAVAVLAGGCGPDEGGPDLSRFAAQEISRSTGA